MRGVRRTVGMLCAAVLIAPPPLWAENSDGLFGQLNVRDMFEHRRRPSADSRRAAAKKSSPAAAAPGSANDKSDESTPHIERRALRPQEHAAEVIERLKRMRGMMSPGVSESNAAQVVNLAREPRAEAARADQAAPARSMAPYPAAGKAVLSLVVSAYPQTHFVEQLEALEELRHRRRVQVGGVLVVALDFVYQQWNEAEQRGAIPLRSKVNSRQRRRSSRRARDYYLPPALDSLGKLGLQASGTVSFAEFARRTGVRSSPVWLVRYQGEDYLFEGLRNPEKLFRADGQFLPPPQPTAKSGI